MQPQAQTNDFYAKLVAPHRPALSASDTKIRMLLEYRVPRKDEMDALQTADDVLRSSSGTLSTETLTRLIRSVTRSRNPGRTNRNVQDAMGRICVALEGRLHGRDRSEVWTMLVNGGFPELANLFV